MPNAARALTDEEVTEAETFAVRRSKKDPILFYRQYAGQRSDDMNDKNSLFYSAIDHTKSLITCMNIYLQIYCFLNINQDLGQSA